MRGWRDGAWAAMVAACLSCVVGCEERSATADNAAAATSESSSPIVVTDDTGRELKFDAPPQRIAATVSFAVEYLLALDHPPVLRPDAPENEVRPAEAHSIPALAVDHGVGPNLEQLAAAEPDLVITTPTFARFAPTIEQSLGVPVAVLRIDSLEDVTDKARWFGTLLDSQEAADKLADRLSQQIEAVEAPEDAEPPTVFAMFGTPAASFAFLPDSYLGSMIEQLGGQLITQGQPASAMSQQLSPLSVELLIQRDPQVILLVHHGPPGQVSQQLSKHPAWSALQAVRSGRVHSISLPLFMTNPGPTAIEALGELRELLYPESAGPSETGDDDLG